MKLEYSGRERIPVAKDVVWAFITDPANIASCMPDVIESKVVDARTFDAVVQVAVGPVRGRFKFHVVIDPRYAGQLHADSRAAVGPAAGAEGAVSFSIVVRNS